MRRGEEKEEEDQRRREEEREEKEDVPLLAFGALKCNPFCVWKIMHAAGTVYAYFFHGLDCFFTLRSFLNGNMVIYPCSKHIVKCDLISDPSKRY